jgi:hypothetical protein
MIAEFLNRQVVLDQLSDVITYLEGQTLQDAAPELLKELREAQQREVNAPSGQPGYDPPESDRRGSAGAVAPLDDYAFVSRDPVISLLQSALNEYATEHAELEKKPPADDERRGGADFVAVSGLHLRKAPKPRRTDDGRRYFDKFSILDVRWAKSKLAEGIRCFRGKHSFNRTPAISELQDRVRLIVVGDWGSGLDRAQKVAAEMEKIIAEGVKNNVTQHVIHLGDVYYSGWAREYRDYALAYWPVAKEQAGSIGSWSLNGNHDMYSGGFGYFDTMLADPRFERQQQSSFFSLVNKNWKVLGLDTSYEDAQLCDPQSDWLQDQLTPDGRRVLMLSHHQLFSAYEKVSHDLVEKISPILQKRPVDAWFWGHEHRCMLYSTYANVKYGRCIGHGGVPVYQWHKERDDYPVPGTYEYRAYYKKGLEHWAVFGFAVLDLDGAVATVTYIDEDGRHHKTESMP